jgi:aryl-alcohol dehydrogenase-like predicted oxidoreductase
MSTLPQRILGRTGIKVSAIGFGGAAIGIDNYLTAESRRSDELIERSHAAIRTALDEGITYFDTAPGYGTGLSETIIGEATRGRRAGITIATKVGVRPEQTPDDWTRSVERSRERLQVDVLDLLQFHGNSWTNELAEWIIDGGVLDWLESMRAKGLTRFIGITAEVPSAGLDRMIATNRFDVLQMAYSVIYQGACDYQRVPFGPIPQAKALGMGVTTMRTATSGVLQKLLKCEFPELDDDRITRLAIRFSLSTAEVDCPLVGMRTPEEVRTNAALARDPSALIDLHKVHDFFDGRPRVPPPEALAKL